MNPRGDGFVRVPNWLLDEADLLTLNELIVYLVLLRYRDAQTGQCFPGFATIAEQSKLSRSSVKRAIPMLEHRGVIHVDRQANKVNVYTVKLPEEAFTPRSTENPPRSTLALPTAPSDAFMGRSTENLPRSTVNPGRSTEEQGMGPQWPPNKNQRTRTINETHEEDDPRPPLALSSSSSTRARARVDVPTSSVDSIIPSADAQDKAERAILRGLQRRGALGRSDCLSLTRGEPKRAVPAVLDRLVLNGQITVTEEYRTENATRPAKVYRLAKEPAA